MNVLQRYALAAALCFPGCASAQGARAGAAAPDFDLAALDGGRVQFSRLRGRPVVISFWSTWCPPCRDEFPALVRAHREHGPEGLYIVGINGRDQERRTEDVTAFVSEFGASFRIGLDERGRARRAYGLIGLPTTVFVDSAGIVRRVHIGPIDEAALSSGIALIHRP